MLRIHAKLGAACILLAASVAYGANSFDGHWTGGAPPQGNCRGTLTLDFVITDGLISGEIRTDVPTPQGYTRGRLLPAGAVAPDGLVNVSIGTATRYPAVFRFTGDNFAANMNGDCGQRLITGTRTK